MINIRKGNADEVSMTHADLTRMSVIGHGNEWKVRYNNEGARRYYRLTYFRDVDGACYTAFILDV